MHTHQQQQQKQSEQQTDANSARQENNCVCVRASDSVCVCWAVMSDTEDGGFDGASFFSLQSPGSTSPTRKQNKETTVTVSGATNGNS